jgi:hypothetical protein
MIKNISILFFILLLLIPTLSHPVSGLTQEDLEFIRFMQENIFYDEDINLDNVIHEDILKAKEGFEYFYGIDFETLKNQPPSDPRFSSPENTWQLYKQALVTRDLNLVQSCLSPDFAKKHIEILSALRKEKMKEIAEEMSPIQKIKQDEKRAKYRIKKTEIYGGQEKDITYYIYFVKMFGNWKISQY